MYLKNPKVGGIGKKKGEIKRDKLRDRETERIRGHMHRMEIKNGIKMASDFSKVTFLLVYYEGISLKLLKKIFNLRILYLDK